MTADPRAALTSLFAAFERHLEASASRRGDDDPAVLAAADDLADAFDSYDDALLEAYGEMTPLDVYNDDDDDDDGNDDGGGDDEDDGGADEGGEDEGDDNAVDAHDDEDGDAGGMYSGFDGDFEEEPEDARR